MKNAKRNKSVGLGFIVLSSIVVGTFLLTTGCGGCRQSRGWSRLTGAALELELPEDFERPISFSSGRDGEKDLFYESSDGKFKVKTYTDSGMWESEIDFVKGE